MPFIPVPGGAQAELRMLLDGQKVENTLWFDMGGTPTAANMLTLAQYLAGWWTTAQGAYLSNQLTLSEVYVTSQETQGAPGASFTPTSGNVGANSNPAAPNNVAFCISFRTAGRGRSARGRNYVVGMQAIEVVSNDLVGSKALGLVNGYFSLIAGAAGVGATWCIASRYHNNAPRVAGILQPVTAVVATDLTVDSQRRRLPGRGK